MKIEIAPDPDAGSESADLRLLKRAIDEHAIRAVTDGSGRIIEANRMFCRISGYEESELLGQDHRILNSGLHSKEFFREMYRKISRGETWRGLIRNRAKDGSHYWVQTTIVSEMSDTGRPRRHVSIRSDVTHLKRTEERLEKMNRALAERNEELKAFACRVSHDLKSPLVTITGYCAMVRKALGRSGGEIGPWIDRIERAAVRMGSCLSGILRLSRLGESADRPVWIDPGEAIAEALFQFERQLAERGVQVRSQFDVRNVFVPPVRFQEVFQNLLSNALIHGCSGEPSVIEIGSVSSREFFSLFVRDQGKGIEPKDQERIFEMFERVDTNSESGTGVGLAIVKRIMESLGGRVRVESAKDRGACFWADFPLEGSKEPWPETT